MIRPAKLDDIPWIMSVARNAYAPGTFDDAAASAYFASIISSPSCLLLRGEKSIMGVTVVGLPYLPSYKAAITLPIASNGNAGYELLEMTRRSLGWAKERGANYMDFASVTGKDLGPLVKRFGGRPVSPTYRIEIDHV